MAQKMCHFFYGIAMNNKQIDLKSPFLLVIDITNKCNLSCKYCFQNLRNTNIKTIPFKTIQSILDEAKELEIFDINICGGEPFTHPDILKILREIISRGFGVSLVTNATKINHQIANELKNIDVIKNTQVSFDSHDENIHNQSRSNFKKAFSGYMNLVNESPDKDLSPSVGIVISKYNYKNLDKTIEFFGNYSRRFHLMNLMFNEDMQLQKSEYEYFTASVIPNIKQIAKERDLLISTINKKYNVETFEFQNVHIDCLAGFTSLVISSNLDIFPCDMAPIKIGKWIGQGSIKESYDSAKKLWRERSTPWCFDISNKKNICGLT